MIDIENETHIISICKKMQRLAKLDRIVLDVSEHGSIRSKHLFRYLDFCGVDKNMFVKNYLSNLQPYMISIKMGQDGTGDMVCVLDNIYKISLCVRPTTEQWEYLTVSVHEGPAKDHNRVMNKGLEKVKLIADSLTGGITNTNTKTFNILVPRGAINVPISLAGEFQDDGTLLVNKKAIDNAILDECNKYIEDLYTSNLDFPSLNEVEIFSVLQQIPFTSNGNSVFSNISVLVDNMFAQDSPLHKQSASFALETYVGNLILTGNQKKELTELIQERYADSHQNDMSVVTDMLVDIINNLDNEVAIVDEKSKDSEQIEGEENP